MINLSKIETKKALELARNEKTTKIRIQGVLEGRVRKGTKNITKNTILLIAKIVQRKSVEIIEKLDTENKFATKYTDEQIEQMALMIHPKSQNALTIRYTQEFFTFVEISWRTAQKIIDKEIELFPNRTNHKSN